MKVIQEVRLDKNERVILANALELVDDICGEVVDMGPIDIFHWLIANTDCDEIGEYVTPEIINISEL